MNISTDPWIPIVWANGRPGEVSLCEAFGRGEDIRDLAVRPHERIALMRLLTCVSQAALNGPADQDKWRASRSEIAPAALAYLKRWHHTFELYGEGARFLQVPRLRRASGKDSDEDDSPVSKLDFALATGNNSTLFDNGGGSDRRFDGSRVALNVLAYQCFSPGGLIGVAEWNESSTSGGGKSNHAPCLAGSMLHALLRGRNLADTLHRNQLTRNQVERMFGETAWGKPIWEQMPSGPSDRQAIQNATRTYLGRLVPLSRAIRLDSNGRSVVLANGLEYVPYPEWREPTSTIVAREIKNRPAARVALRTSVERAAWRELHALTVMAVDMDTIGGPAALRNVADDPAFDLWVGGLAANKAKFVDTTESVFHVPTEMLQEMGQRIYGQGVRWAESVSFRLRRAVSTYHRHLGDDLDRAEFRDRRRRVQNKAAAQFWTDVEQAVPRLLEVSERPDKLGQPAEWSKSDWGKALWTSMHAAYEYACPHSTSRQMCAYALGLNTLRFTQTESPDQVQNNKEAEV